MTKLTKTHVTIKENQIDRIIKFLNKSKTMVDYIRTTHDVRLSDVRKLEEGMEELADMFELYIPEYDHTGSTLDSWEKLYIRKSDTTTAAGSILHWEEADDEIDYSKELDKARGR